LSSLDVPEDADDPGLHVVADAADAHRADRADVEIACEYVVLDEPEAEVPEPCEPAQKRFAPLDPACHLVLARDVPYHLRGDHGLDQIEVTSAKGVSGSFVGDGVRMFLRHA
jgi:hypothetical protein